MLRPSSFILMSAACSLGYLVTTSAMAADTVYYNDMAPAAGATVVETTTYYADPTPQAVITTTNPAAPVVVYQEYSPRGSQFNRDRYYVVTRNYEYDHSNVNRQPGDKTAGENDPRSQRNRLQYDSCPPGQAKRGFC